MTQNDAIVALIADLYRQVTALTQELAAERAVMAELKSKAKK